MTDVRLTATNPVDSSVVPVACNEKGELKLEEPLINSDEFVAKTGDTMTGNLHLGDGIALNTDGSAQFASGKIDVYDTGKMILGDNITLDVDGSAQFSGIVSLGRTNPNTGPGTWIQNLGGVYTTRTNDLDPAFAVYKVGGAASPNFRVLTNGSAEFAGDVVVGSRNKQWMIVESNGLAHLVEQTTRQNEISTADLAPDSSIEYPPLRDIPGELTMVEQQLQKVLEKLRMVPEAGWEVWDGSD